MANFNKVILVGNIARDLELAHTGSGLSVVSNSLAVSNIRTVNNEKVEDTAFIEFTVFGKSAETLAQYQSKGSNILIEGRLVQDNWVDKESGKNRSKLKVLAERVQFLGGKPSGGGYTNNTQQQAPQQQAPQQQYQNNGDYNNGDSALPF